MAYELPNLAGARRFRDNLPRFRRAKDGTTAVEFGLLGLPFLALICACLENGLVYWQSEILQQALVEASRQIYTGNFQTANAGVTDSATLLTSFRSKICTQPNGVPRLTIFNCANVRVSVTEASGFSGASPVSPVAVNPTTKVSDWNASFASYKCASASAIMVVQAAVDIPVFFPLLGAAVSNLPNKRRVIQAATVFKVEPYTTKSVCS